MKKIWIIIATGAVCITVIVLLGILLPHRAVPLDHKVPKRIPAVEQSTSVPIPVVSSTPTPRIVENSPQPVESITLGMRAFENAWILTWDRTDASGFIQYTILYRLLKEDASSELIEFVNISDIDTNQYYLTPQSFPADSPGEYEFVLRIVHKAAETVDSDPVTLTWTPAEPIATTPPPSQTTPIDQEKMTYDMQPVRISGAADGKRLKISWTPFEDENLFGYYLLISTTTTNPTHPTTRYVVYKGKALGAYFYIDPHTHAGTKPGETAYYSVATVYKNMKACTSNAIQLTMPENPNEPADSSDVKLERLALSGYVDGNDLIITWEASQSPYFERYYLNCMTANKQQIRDFSQYINQQSTTHLRISDGYRGLKAGVPYTFGFTVCYYGANGEELTATYQYITLTIPLNTTATPTSTPVPTNTPIPDTPTPVPTSEPTPEPTPEPTSEPTPETSDPPSTGG